MRTLVLIALGGSLLYFTWTRYGGEEEPEQAPTALEEELPSGGGQFMSPSQNEEAIANSEPPESAHPAAPEGELAGASPSEQAPERVIDADGGGLPDLAALGDPLHEGELMAHRVGDLQEYISGPGAKLSVARRNLLIAYGLLIRGMPGQAEKYANGLEKATDVTSEEWALLQSARQGKSVRARNASHSLHPSPLVTGVSMGLMAEEGARLLREQNWKGAAEIFSELLLAEIDAPWEANRSALATWSDSLESAQANYRWNRQGAWPAQEVVVLSGDTLVAIRKRVIAQRPNLSICTGLVHRANQLGKYLQEDDVLRIPTDQAHTIVDLSARWLFYMHGSEVVAAWPIAIGREGEETTPGSYMVGEKAPEPPWYPPGRVVPYGDPENPLGTRWIGLENSNGLGIHGTWEPGTIGTMASDGCVRMRNQSVEELFEIIPKGSRVLVRP